MIPCFYEITDRLTAAETPLRCGNFTVQAWLLACYCQLLFNFAGVSSVYGRRYAYTVSTVSVRILPGRGAQFRAEYSVDEKKDDEKKDG